MPKYASGSMLATSGCALVALDTSTLSAPISRKTSAVSESRHRTESTVRNSAVRNASTTAPMRCSATRCTSALNAVAPCDPKALRVTSYSRVSASRKCAKNAQRLSTMASPRWPSATARATFARKSSISLTRSGDMNMSTLATYRAIAVPP